MYTTLHYVCLHGIPGHDGGPAVVDAVEVVIRSIVVAVIFVNAVVIAFALGGNFVINFTFALVGLPFLSALLGRCVGSESTPALLHRLDVSEKQLFKK